MIFSDKIATFDEPQMRSRCNVGVAIVGAGALAAGASVYSAGQAGKAGQEQAAAANAAIEEQKRQFGVVQNNLAPYMAAGGSALTDLQSRLPFLTSPIQMDEATLQQTPGYQFNMSQGLRAAQNQLTASGLGRSGAAVKAADRFATGLADNTYQTQFNLENTNRTNTYNRLLGLTQVGQNAAAGVSSAGLATGQGVSNSLIQGGNAQAAGIMGGANYLNQGAQGLSGNLLLAALQGQNGQQGGIYANNAPAYANPYQADPANYAGYQPPASGSWYTT